MQSVAISALTGAVAPCAQLHSKHTNTSTLTKAKKNIPFKTCTHLQGKSFLQQKYCKHVFPFKHVKRFPFSNPLPSPPPSPSSQPKLRQPKLTCKRSDAAAELPCSKSSRNLFVANVDRPLAPPPPRRPSRTSISTPASPTAALPPSPSLGPARESPALAETPATPPLRGGEGGSERGMGAKNKIKHEW